MIDLKTTPGITIELRNKAQSIIQEIDVLC
jgi:hypothetical protein